MRLDKKQFLKSIRKLDEKDRLEIYNELKKSLFPQRFEKLLESTKTDKITFDEITEEVESVRKERYD